MAPADRLAHCPRARPVAGFTLVELLIALAMVALITLLLFSGLRVGSRAWDGVDAAAERTGALRQANAFLLRTLSQARAMTLVYDGESVPVFAGDTERLEFVAPLSEHVGIPGLYVLRLESEGSGDGAALVLTRWLIHSEVLDGTDDIPAWEPLKERATPSLDGIPLDRDAAAGAFGRTSLLDRLDTFELSYYGVAAGDTEPDWHEEWLEQGTLPALIRVRFATIDQTWPDLLVAFPAQRT
jgi:general secretion pathway protein J